jgi:hypothetical protein
VSITTRSYTDFADRDSADQHVGKARPGLDVELLDERRLAQVHLQEQHPRAQPRRRLSQLTSDRGLAVTLCGRCDHDCTQVTIDVEEAQMSTNQTERLGLCRRQIAISEPLNVGTAERKRLHTAPRYARCRSLTPAVRLAGQYDLGHLDSTGVAE